MRRRPPRPEPVRCRCEPGANAAREHAKPGNKAADHLDPRCPHSELRHTTKPAKKTTTVQRLRIA